MRQLFRLSNHVRRLPRIQDFLRRSLNLNAYSTSSVASTPVFSDEPIEPEAYMVTERRKFVAENISNAISDPTRRLFARQFKVIQDDIIHIEHNVPLDVGHEIKFEKVLMLGGTNFTLIGRPLLNPKFAHVRATVIEKTTTSPEVVHDYRKQNVHNPLWVSQELTVLRINNISVEKAILGEV